MLLWSNIYARGDINPEDPLCRPNKESNTELEAARAAVEVILEHNNIALETIQPSDLSTREWLAKAEEDLDWREPGEKTLAVPDVRQLFPAFEYMKKQP